MKEVTVLTVKSTKVLVEDSAEFIRRYCLPNFEYLRDGTKISAHLPDDKIIDVMTYSHQDKIDFTNCKIYAFTKYDRGVTEIIYLAVDPQLDGVLKHYIQEKYKESLDKQTSHIETLRCYISEAVRDRLSMLKINDSYADRILKFNRKPLLKRLWAAFKGRI